MMAVANDTRFLIKTAPHIHSGRTTSFAMWGVVAALIPVLLASLYLFGFQALMLVLAVCAGAVLADWAGLKLRGKVWLGEWSVLVTGLILALTLPPTLPWWMGFIGGAFAILIGKQVFGGLGTNPFNPAAVGRVFLLVNFATHMTRWVRPFDAVTTATPLAGTSYDSWPLITGMTGGSLGETSVFALLLGACVLFALRLIDWRAPVATIVGTAVGAIIVGQSPIFHIMSGGLLFAAVFMVTDWVTAPTMRRGRWMFGLGVGFITVAIRAWGSYPEGVSFAILLMNGVTPLLNRMDMQLLRRRL